MLGLLLLLLLLLGIPYTDGVLKCITERRECHNDNISTMFVIANTGLKYICMPQGERNHWGLWCEWHEMNQ